MGRQFYSVAISGKMQCAFLMYFCKNLKYSSYLFLMILGAIYEMRSDMMKQDTKIGKTVESDSLCCL